jgi:hypothetical protein
MTRAVVAAALLILAVTGPVATARAEPLISRTCNDSPDCGGWFTRPVALDWTVSAGTVTSGCIDVTLSRDTTGTQQGCIATDGIDDIQRNVTIKIDLTPPAVTSAIPDRPPDHKGWYTRPVTFAPVGEDGLSGLAGCDQAAYAGPDSAAASIVATCRDMAGNLATRAFPLQYDATAPDLTTLDAETGDRLVQLSWPGVATAKAQRRPGLRGARTTTLRAQADGLNDLRVRNGVRYRYVVTVADEAGNTSKRTIAAVPGPHLLQPLGGITLAAPPLLRWTPVRGARYYNVQLFRDGKKILSAWPRKPRLQLERRWRFAGDRRRLTEGDYRWFVWPGEGARADRGYGDRIGARRFTVDR